MDSYVDYGYYCNKYNGVSTEFTDFDRFSVKASLFVREITFNRVDKGNIPDEVKDAVCAVCEIMKQDEEMLKEYGGRSVKSENNDGYSVSFVTEEKEGQMHEATLWNKMYAAARPYLLFTGLLYRG